MIVSFFFVYSCGIQVYRYLKTKLFPTNNDCTSKESRSTPKEELEFPIASEGTSYIDAVGDIKFAPPVYSQRYLAVSEELEHLGPFKKIVELGCNNLALFPFLKHHEGIEEAVLVDLNGQLLVNSRTAVAPLTSDHIRRRNTPFRVRILAGNAAVPDLSLAYADAVVAIELIEHMLPHDLFDFPYCIFGIVQPRLAVFTTPNADFNILFKHPERLRDPDHKFEWTRREFHDWAKNITLRYPEYDVTLKGIGAGPEGSHQYGTCSQMAVFIRNCPPNCDLTKFKVGAYELIEDVTYPFQNQVEPTLEERIVYYLRKYFTYEEKLEKYYSYTEDQVEVPFQEIFRFLSSISDDTDLIRKVLHDNGYMIRESSSGEEVVIPPPQECSSSSAGGDSFGGRESEEVLFSENGIPSDSDGEAWETESPPVSPFQSDFLSSTPLPQRAAGDVPPSKNVCPLEPAREFLIDLQAFSAGDKTRDTFIEPTFLGSSHRHRSMNREFGEGPSGVGRGSSHSETTYQERGNDVLSAKGKSPSRTRSSDFCLGQDKSRIIDPIGLERTSCRMVNSACPTCPPFINDLPTDSTNDLDKSPCRQGVEVDSSNHPEGVRENKFFDDGDIKFTGERDFTCGWSGSPDICENWRNAANSEGRQDNTSETSSVDILQQNDLTRHDEVQDHISELPSEVSDVSEISVSSNREISYSADVEYSRISSELEVSSSPVGLDTSNETSIETLCAVTSNSWSYCQVPDESKVDSLQNSEIHLATDVTESSNLPETSSCDESSSLHSIPVFNVETGVLFNQTCDKREVTLVSDDSYLERVKSEIISDQPDSFEIKNTTISEGNDSPETSNYPESSSDSGITARLPNSDEGTSCEGSKGQNSSKTMTDSSRTMDEDDSLLSSASSVGLKSNSCLPLSELNTSGENERSVDTSCDKSPCKQMISSKQGCKLSHSVNNSRSEAFESEDTVPSSIIIADTENVHDIHDSKEEKEGFQSFTEYIRSEKNLREMHPISKGAVKDLNTLELDAKKDTLLQVPCSLSQSCDSAALCEQLSHTIEASQSEDNIVYKNVATGVNLSPCDTDASLSSNQNPLKSCLRLSINGNYELEPEDEKKERANKTSKEQTPINVNMLDFTFANVKPEDQASVMNRCKSLQLIRDSVEKRANRFSLCCEKDEHAENKLYGMGWSLEEVGGCWREETEGATIDDSRSQSRAADSGYPNTSDRDPDMDTDLTPEQVDELLSENESSFDEHDEDEEEHHVDRPPLPGAAAPVQFVEHVENGDVANNNQDGEGNNMDGEEIIAFELVQIQPNEERQEAPVRHDSDSEDENKYVSASESLLSETVVADEESKDDMDDTFDSDIWSSTPAQNWKGAVDTPKWATPGPFSDDASVTPKNISLVEEIRWQPDWDAPGRSTNLEDVDCRNDQVQSNWTELNSASSSNFAPLTLDTSSLSSAQMGGTSQQGDSWTPNSQPYSRLAASSQLNGPSYVWRDNEAAGPSFPRGTINYSGSESPSTRHSLELGSRAMEWRAEPWEGLASSSSLIAHASSSSSLSPQENQNSTFHPPVENDFPSWLRNIFVDDLDAMGDSQETSAQNEASSDFLLLPDDQSLSANIPTDLMGGGEPHFQS